MTLINFLPVHLILPVYLATQVSGSPLQAEGLQFKNNSISEQLQHNQEGLHGQKEDRCGNMDGDF
jgi:hypothetical protein